MPRAQAGSFVIRGLVAFRSRGVPGGENTCAWTAEKYATFLFTSAAGSSVSPITGVLRDRGPKAVPQLGNAGPVGLAERIAQPLVALLSVVRC